ncbi:glycerate dehydrogenase-like isoform X2 [Mya arenaria]|uniref:glycerate dehydrogenase-like isoform X2 n=1 Tax=Mya arenaria TaxID=6604 RepID=UPI0022E0A909|nr:glycerate dehydrogenase-like isoform X2 [Mya arenaria]
MENITIHISIPMGLTSLEDQIRNSEVGKHVAFVTIKTFSNPATHEGVDLVIDSLKKNEAPPFILTKTPGDLNSSFITEYVLGYIIAMNRKIFEARESQSRKDWQQRPLLCNQNIAECTVGILGIGEIGKHIAKACKVLGLHVWGMTRTEHVVNNKCESIDVYRTRDHLQEVLENSDYIVCVLPSTPSTRNLLSGGVLEACKRKNTVLINVGRGDIIDEDSIVQAISNGWLGGAVLDVFPIEPLPVSSPLWDLPGVVITPHTSGWSASPEFLAGIIKVYTDNIQRYITGQPLENVLDWQQGY